MFGLCMPTGEVYLVMNDGKKENIMCADLGHPRKEILEDKWIRDFIKKYGYKKVEAIVYERGSNKTTVSMADYYAENGQELED